MKRVFEGDPTVASGNRKVRTGIKGVTAMAALALAACSSSPAHKPAAPVHAETSTVARGARGGEAGPNSRRPEAGPNGEAQFTPEKGKESETLKAHIQATAEDFATRIINKYNDPETRGRKLLTDEKVSSNIEITILLDAKTELGGESGQYSLVAGVGKDKNGNFDPKTVDKISIYAANLIAHGNGELPVPVYGFEVTKNDTSGDWSITHSVSDGVNPAKAGRFDTNSYNMGGNEQYSPLSDGFLNAMIGQAHTVFEAAMQSSPVSLPPAIGK